MRASSVNALKNLKPGFIAETDFYGELMRVVPQPVTFRVESWNDIVEEMKPLFELHWQEIALDKGSIKLDPDYEKYAALCNEGVLHVVAARAGSTLVGYHVSFIHPHLHYKSTLTCSPDIFYLRPEYRNGMTGYKLMKFFRDSVKARGVKRIYMNTKLSIDIDPILRRLGFRQVEKLYSMVV